MAKRKRMSRPRRYYKAIRRRAKKTTIPIAPLMGLVAGIAEPVQYAVKGEFGNAIQIGVINYTGYDMATKKFYFDRLQNGLLPLVAGMLVHKFVGGKPLGLNQMLAQAGVPYVRI